MPEELKPFHESVIDMVNNLIETINDYPSGCKAISRTSAETAIFRLVRKTKIPAEHIDKIRKVLHDYKEALQYYRMELSPDYGYKELDLAIQQLCKQDVIKPEELKPFHESVIDVIGELSSFNREEFGICSLLARDFAETSIFQLIRKTKIPAEHMEKVHDALNNYMMEFYPDVGHEELDSTIWYLHKLNEAIKS